MVDQLFSESGNDGSRVSNRHEVHLEVVRVK